MNVFYTLKVAFIIVTIKDRGIIVSIIKAKSRSLYFFLLWLIKNKI